MTVEHEVVGLEREALKRWLTAIRRASSKISAPDVVYFDPFTERRIDGLEVLKAHYAPLRGKIFAPRSELVNPLVLWPATPQC